MSNKSSTDGDVNAALALTADDCNKYLVSKGVKRGCKACEAGSFSLVTDPANIKPLIIAGPIAPSHETALWYINLVCERCGNSIFFNVSTVSEFLASQKEFT